ncbi:hypothetical protein [uncultured Chryseobacterium sp.]|uniref:Ig-like domain-containing protein n=1 Tax=uncultured Chryseobacterium sp. TaxID=259322 RepID=UPI0025CF5AD6|nr:hypothetical protein [uncultured Chryseobacterium sp.]
MNQLSNITTQYRKFSKGQYIEHTQFNEFLDFFEDQDRLSRIALQGVGIVCGLKPGLVYNNRLLSAIQLSQGIAVTTDGDLLTLNDTNKASEDLYVSDLKTIDLQNKDYTHFKVYDNFKVKYPAFYDNGNQIELWELVSGREAGSDSQPISKLSDMADKYLLLYLESYEKEVKPCRGVDCDNHGIRQIRNLKVLVTTKNGIENILKKDRIQRHALFIKDILKAEKQERVIIERLLLDKGAEAQIYISDVKELYLKALEKNDYGASVFKKINAISQVIGLPVLDHEKFKSLLKQYFNRNIGFQYAYDLIRDLMDTYAEIINVLPGSFTGCMPDLASFPKHVMLGKLSSDIQLDACRHRFYNSPVLVDEKQTRQVKFLIERFTQQVENFKYSGLQDGAEIKVTPSQKLTSLGDKAIPFYYNITEGFLKVWNFDKTANRSSGENRAYDTAVLSSAGHIQNPVDFNLDKNTFYNIEGHQGMPYETAFEQLKEIRDRQQLGFDIMLLSFEELNNNKDLFKAYFNEYVDKHPGLEHKRGVERGGTFVMFYEINGKEINIMADFSIPYTCCTPKPKIQLSLPASVVCSESESLPFTVFPVNGVVTARVGTNQQGGVEFSNGRYFFNPSAISPALRGQDIAFNVNGKPVNCRIKVIAQPDIKIVVDSVFYPESASMATTVNFIVSGPGFKDYNYRWDFLDNGNAITSNPDIEGNVHYTFYNLDRAKIPTIKVKVEGGGCIQDITIDDWYNAPVEENKVPVAIANASSTNIQLPTNSIELKGSSSYDSDGTIVSYLWKQIGTTPSTANISNPNIADTTATGLVEGNYTFQLTVKDNLGAIASDEVNITVNKAVKLPSLTEIGNTTTGSGSNGSRTQTFKVGPNVSEGNKFEIEVYSVVLTVIATAADTPSTIALKLKELIINTSRQQWNAFGTAPTEALGFPPKASSLGDVLEIFLNYQNQFFGNASVS